MTTLQQTLDGLMELPLDQREMVVDILDHRNAEARRKVIAAEAREALAAFHRGELPPPQTADELIRDLNGLN